MSRFESFDVSLRESWVVTYSDHDNGSAGGYFFRSTAEIANRSAARLRECGYRRVDVRLLSKTEVVK